MSAEKDLVNFNFAEGPDGTVAFNAVFIGGFDQNKPTHRFAMNLIKYLESEAVSKSFRMVNGEETEVTTLPAVTIAGGGTA